MHVEITCPKYKKDWSIAIDKNMILKHALEKLIKHQRAA